MNETITPAAELHTRDWIIDDLIAADYGATPTGNFQNTDRIILRWERPDWFEYVRMRTSRSGSPARPAR